MDLLEVLILGLVLSADSFSAALAMGARDHSPKDAYKFAFMSGSAEALIALVGALAGRSIISYIDQFDHWFSFILLLSVALHMFKESYDQFKNPLHDSQPKAFHSFSKILLVSVATSIDALAVGVSLGIMGKTLYPYIISIGFFAFISTLLGMAIAKRIAKLAAPIFNTMAAIILTFMAVNFLYEGLK
ncbi:MAG: hypothetical protein CME62_06495 [Halobacteriovoraceae bacterium]|nr:hypothetical protein [Halobacteriovoraceae bacterium]|tara:strand:+ start:16530 stop:17093 length:564 start_codon:yes stop_codon:yes gene_type:complete